MDKSDPSLKLQGCALKAGEQVVIEDRLPEVQAETRRCMMAMLESRLGDAVRSAELLAASQLESGKDAPKMSEQAHGHAGPSLAVGPDVRGKALK